MSLVRKTALVIIALLLGTAAIMPARSRECPSRKAVAAALAIEVALSAAAGAMVG
jgi:hypothetical protein